MSVHLSPKRSDRRSGVSLVELLVVMLIVVLAGVGLSTAIGYAMAIEQNYREESAVRTALALQMEYAERYFSLATNVVGETATYRQETGGVTFESTHWAAVKSLAMSTNVVVTNNNKAITNSGALYFQIDTDNPNQPGVRSVSPDGLVRIAPATTVLARLEGTGDVRRLVLTAQYPIRKRIDGSWTTVLGTMTEERPIRLWNHTP